MPAWRGSSVPCRVQARRGAASHGNADEARAPPPAVGVPAALGAVFEQKFAFDRSIRHNSVGSWTFLLPSSLANRPRGSSGRLELDESFPNQMETAAIGLSCCQCAGGDCFRHPEFASV